ncbi:hypothetical protein SFRURICE_016285 [Spodoptera frugiperda]|nr:hypothetical protein SFRURICE_016285 [Spodoptera frugiperda]
MEPGFVKADSNNLPRIDAIMLDRFFASNNDFCSSELRNLSTYDDAVSYVQLKRENKFCTVKCKICPEHKVHAKLYGCTLVVDEEDDIILSVQCQDCVASQGGCSTL